MSLHSLKLTAKALENRPSQKETSIPTMHFQSAMLVSGRVVRRDEGWMILFLEWLVSEG